MDWLRERRSGWDVVHVFDVGLRGSPDSDIFAWAQENKFLIITFDVRFADGQEFPVTRHHGLIRLRVRQTPATPSIEVATAALERLFNEIDDADLPGSLVIVGPSRIRVIPGPLPLIDP